VTLTTFFVGLCLAVGLMGIIVPVLPGLLLILVALLAWALEIGTATAWVTFSVAAAFIVLGTVLKYLLPGKRLKATVPTSTLWWGALGGLVGFFVIPVVGALAGFPIGVYLAERQRVGPDLAWPSTRAALKAIGQSILIEFLAGVAASITWVLGVVAS